MHTFRRGFTLIELVLVISIISVLAVVVLSALKPAARMAETRDAKRAQDLSQILTAVHSCVIDKGDSSAMPTCVGTYTAGQRYEIVEGAITSGCSTSCSLVATDSNCLRLDQKLSDYFVNLPTDPAGVSTGHTKYALTVHSNGMTVIESCAAENGEIKVSR